MYIYVIYYDWNKCEIFFFLLELLEIYIENNSMLFYVLFVLLNLIR